MVFKMSLSNRKRHRSGPPFCLAEFVRPGRACVSSHAGDTLLVVRSLGPCNRNCYVVLILVFLITFIRQWDNISFSYFVEIHSFGSYFIHYYIAQHRFSCLVTREQVCERRIKFYGSWRQYWKTTFAAMDCKHLDETVRIGWVIPRFDSHSSEPPSLLLS